MVGCGTVVGCARDVLSSNIYQSKSLCTLLTMTYGMIDGRTMVAREFFLKQCTVARLGVPCGLTRHP